ncbi:PAS domain S-box protein [Methanoculleus sp. MH98A]|uniref:PAS domain S-box protein n=1 Tax=Methanoculleus sp. MH98A TaxID=1495314 RepID=UPI0009E1BB14|nr:PAS domain S-box protein [Methanoculleus sp. MH98A]
MPPPDFTATAPDKQDLPADEAVPCRIWISGPDGVAPALRETTREERCDPVWAGNLHPGDAETMLAQWERRNDTGLSWRCNYRIRGADGRYRTIASRGIPVRDAAGRIVLWAGVDLDVTGRDESCWQTRELCTLSAVARAIEGGADAGEIFRETAALLARGFRHPGAVSVRIEPGTAVSRPGRIVAGIDTGERSAGQIVVEYGRVPQGGDDPFLPQEHALVRAVAMMLGAAVAPAPAGAASSGHQYRLLFDQMPDAALLLEILRDASGDPAGFRVVWINRKTAESLGRRREEVVGEDLVTAVPSITPAAFDLLYRVARTGTPVHRDVSSPATGACYELKAYRPQYDRLVVIAEDITERRRAEEMLREQQIALDNRVRELATLYAVSGVIERPGVSVEDVLREVTVILPAGWRHPEDAAARIVVDGREYLSAGFVETPWRQESPIIVQGRIVGRVEICYRRPRPKDDGVPFLIGERRLIDAVAGRLGRVIERMRANKALGRSEKKYRLLFERMLESYTLYEVVRDDAGNPVDYRISELNEKAAEVFGRSREELIGQRLFDIFPTIAKGACALYGAVAETGRPVQRRLQEPRTGRWYDLQIYRPQAGMLAVTGQDITEQKKAELALRESEERFRGIFEQAGTGIALIDSDGRIMEVNPALVRMFGYGEDELYGMRSYDLIYPPDREGADSLHRQTALGKGIRREKRYLTKDGRIIWGRLTTSLLHDTGEGGLVIAMLEDITDWREMQNALAENEERFRQIAQRSFDMIYTCYHDRGITYISPAVTRILGYTPDEFIGRGCHDYVVPSSLPVWEEGRKKIARGEPVEGLEIEFRRKDGSVAFLELNESPIVEDGRVVGVQIVGRDVSDRVRYEDMRLQAFYQIEQNIEQFAVLADHIRLPLQVILGMADLADEEAMSAKIREQVERINAIVKQLDEGWVESRDIREFLRRNELV